MQVEGIAFQTSILGGGVSATNGLQIQALHTVDDIRDFPKIRGPYFGVLTIRILLFSVLNWGPLFSETPVNPALPIIRNVP